MKGIMKTWKRIKNKIDLECGMLKEPKIVITTKTKEVALMRFKRSYKTLINNNLAIDITDTLEMELGSDRNKWTYKKFKACCEWILNCIKEDER